MDLLKEDEQNNQNNKNGDNTGGIKIDSENSEGEISDTFSKIYNGPYGKKVKNAKENGRVNKRYNSSVKYLNKLLTNLQKHFH